ncbi:hypothetical protein U1Q18_037501 [Sarracenia purpurea var. burkii]
MALAKAIVLQPSPDLGIALNTNVDHSGIIDALHHDLTPFVFSAFPSRLSLHSSSPISFPRMFQGNGPTCKELWLPMPSKWRDSAKESLLLAEGFMNGESIAFKLIIRVLTLH